MSDAWPHQLGPVLIFAGQQYSEGCGFSDYVASAETITKAVAAATAYEDRDWWEVVDIRTGEKQTGNTDVFERRLEHAKGRRDAEAARP